MKRTEHQLTKSILANTCHSLEKHHLPRIERCLGMLSDKDVWWRPHRSSNSIGNLALHLSGNVSQWIIASLGGMPFRRERDKEFSERRRIPRHKLAATLRASVRTACRLIRRLRPEDLERQYTIQGVRVTGLQALLHVSEHFAFHSGQIIYITKLKRRQDLAFTRLPGEKPKRARRTTLPVL